MINGSRAAEHRATCEIEINVRACNINIRVNPNLLSFVTYPLSYFHLLLIVLIYDQWLACRRAKGNLRDRDSGKI